MVSDSLRMVYWHLLKCDRLWVMHSSGSVIQYWCLMVYGSGSMMQPWRLMVYTWCDSMVHRCRSFMV